LGRRAIRDVLRSEGFLDRPTCDVSLAELQIINSKEKGSFDFRTSSNTQIEVEIAPCVTATLRWPPRSSSSEQLVLPKISIEAIESIQFDLEGTAEKLQDIAGRLSRAIADPDKRRGRSDRKPRRK
jgi:hypothetical protein